MLLMDGQRERYFWSERIRIGQRRKWLRSTIRSCKAEEEGKEEGKGRWKVEDGPGSFVCTVKTQKDAIHRQPVKPQWPQSGINRQAASMSRPLSVCWHDPSIDRPASGCKSTRNLPPWPSHLIRCCYTPPSPWFDHDRSFGGGSDLWPGPVICPSNIPWGIDRSSIDRSTSSRVGNYGRRASWVQSITL